MWYNIHNNFFNFNHLFIVNFIYYFCILIYLTNHSAPLGHVAMKPSGVLVPHVKSGITLYKADPVVMSGNHQGVPGQVIVSMYIGSGSQAALQDLESMRVMLVLVWECQQVLFVVAGFDVSDVEFLGYFTSHSVS
jgi:hypothetical protein